MVNVLVCVKRVPDVSGEIRLTADGLGIDTTFLGHTMSLHEQCAVELAIAVAAQSGGEATVLTLGGEAAVEQLRHALAVGCTRAVRIDAEPDAVGPADVADAIAEVVRAREAAGTPYDLLLLGNDAADTGDFQVGVRLAYALDRPVVAGAATVTVAGESLTARVDGSAGTEVYEVALPAVVTVLEGGVAPRYPSVPGRMKAKRVEIDTVTPTTRLRGSGRTRLELPAAQPSQVRILGEGPAAAPAVVDLFEQLGVVTR